MFLPFTLLSKEIRLEKKIDAYFNIIMFRSYLELFPKVSSIGKHNEIKKYK